MHWSYNCKATAAHPAPSEKQTKGLLSEHMAWRAMGTFVGKTKQNKTYPFHYVDAALLPDALNRS